jgi:lysophospholipase L1-like esterase
MVATGDSKSFGFATELAANISYTNPHGGVLAIDKSHPGYDLADLQAVTATDVAAVAATGLSIPYILITIGNGDIYNLWNDPSTEAAQHAQFLSDYQDIVDAWHTQYPDIEIYCCREWSRDPQAYEPTIRGWIGEIVTANSNFVHYGPLEVDLIVPPDNGVTYYSDGIHPNADGYHLLALDWQSRMGL